MAVSSPIASSTTPGRCSPVRCWFPSCLGCGRSSKKRLRSRCPTDRIRRISAERRSAVVLTEYLVHTRPRTRVRNLRESKEHSPGNRLAFNGCMRIAQISPLYERVPPMLYGGTERVVFHLVEELVRRCHDVPLFASRDSRTSADLLSPIARALRLDHDVSDPLAPHIVLLSEVFERAEEYDLIHSHVDYLAFPFSRLVATPTVHTMHGRLDMPQVHMVMRHFDDVPLVSISDAQRRPLEDLDLAWAGTVYHGLPMEEYPIGRGGPYLAFLGRISPEKRPDLAIAVAKRAGIPLKIAAKVDPVDRAYFETEIEPLLGDPLIQFVGEICEA